MSTRPGVRYVLVGAYNTVFGYAAFAVLYQLFARQVHYVALLVVAQVVAILNAYVAYRLVVFRVHGQVFRDLMRFSTVYLVALGANAALLPVAVDGLGVHPLAAQAVLVSATVIASYIAHTRFSFRRDDRAIGA